ncbi:MAG: ABC transporter substrate-binding protein [Actinomycetia bacterium]|nr:ABC transporter substrate-binding protein [Actinomycetes bacterium]
MRNKTWFRLLLGLFAFSLIAAACGSDSDDTSSGDSGDEGTDEGSGDEGTDEGTDEGSGDEAAADLASECPSPLVIQTDWFPESEHGALYELVGDDYTVDTDNKVVSGSMVIGGEDLGIDFEVRTGGPAIGFAPVASHMYTDDSIHLGYGTTDGQILRHEDTPMVSVIAPLEINPQMIMWDPEVYPDIKTIADLGDEGVTINVFAGGTFSEVFVAQGVWSAGQVDPSYDGGPATFIAAGDIAQQGFASAEPYNYKNVFDEFGKDVTFELLHDTGFAVYSQTIAIRPDDKADLDGCLKLVVPIIQQAIVDYGESPDRANGIIVDAVEQFADFWVYDLALAEFSIAKQLELGLVGNGPDSTVGNMDPNRIQDVIDQLVDAGMSVPEGLTPSDIMTNEYIDESIGL